MIKDLINAFQHKDLWLYLAWQDVLAKYRRTTLGPIWAIIISAVSILCMSVLGAILFKTNLRDFLPHVACGMVIWTFISSIILESCSVFLSYAGLIQNVKLPLLAFILRMFLRNTILFLHSFVVLLLVLFIYATPNLYFFLIIPSFVIYLLNALALGVILGFFSTRYRDILYIMQALLNILVLMTPIMWKVEMLGQYAILANLNPFTHFIALFRDPLLGRSIDLYSLQYITIFTIGNLVLAHYLYAKFKNRLVFWL
jgi:ABC-type polysaccharide/polyol phosphate export permease